MKYNNEPWADVQIYLKSKYNILGTVDLLSVDNDPDAMYTAFKSLLKEVYQPDDRILIYHYDTDFYHENCGVGFTIYNTLRCITSLNIPISFCLFLTNHYGLKKEIEIFMQVYCPTDGPIQIFESNYQQLQTTPVADPTSLDSTLIESHYNCMLGKKRVHRVMLLCALKDKNILRHGVLSWHFNNEASLSLPKENTSTTQNHHLTFLVTQPWTRINEGWYCNQILNEFYRRHYQNFEGNFKDSRIEGEPNSDSNRFIIPAIKSSFLYISAETVYNYPYPYMTEKTFRAFLHKRPFVIVGAPGSIAQLQKLGFKTFSQFWNEDYDNITNPSIRLEKVIEIIQWICSMSIKDLREMCNNMKELLDYNFDYYQTHFAKKNLINQLKSI